MIGTVRNLFVSELPVIYYYHHENILPFAYNPESRIGVRELLLQGDIGATMRVVFQDFPKLLWFALLFGMYCSAIWGWIHAWHRNRLVFFTFTLFFAIFGYFLVASGPYVDAKYRMPAMALIEITALYGVVALWNRLLVLRFIRK